MAVWFHLKLYKSYISIALLLLGLFEGDSLGPFKPSLNGEVIAAGPQSEQRDPGRSGGSGVNRVSDGSLVSKGLLLVLYTDMTSQLVSFNWHV